MDSSGWDTLLPVIGINSSVAIVCALGFYFVVLPHLLTQNGENKMIASVLWTNAFRPEMMPEGVLQTQKLAAVLYFEFSDLLFKLQMLLVLACCILCPVDWYEGKHYLEEESPSWFARASVFNLKDDADAFWAHAIMCWLISIVTLVLVIQARREFRAIERKYDFGISEFSVEFHGLPRLLIEPELIRDEIMQSHPKVHEVHIAYELNALLDLSRRRKELQGDKSVIEHAIEVQYQPRACCCQKIDLEASRDRADELLADVTDKIQEERTKPLKGTGFVFITFNEREAATDALAHGSLKNSLTDLIKRYEQRGDLQRAVGVAGDIISGDVILDRSKPAREPELVAWKNLKVRQAERCGRQVLANTTLAVLIIFVFSGNSVLDSLKQLNGQMPGWISDTIANFLPSLATTLTAWIVVPLLIQFVEEIAQYESHEQYAIYFIWKYFGYLFVAVVFVMTTALSLTSMIKSWLDHGNLDATFSNVFESDQTVLYIKYVLNFALITSPLELLQYVELLMAQLGACIKCCCQCCRCGRNLTEDMVITGIPTVKLFQFPRQYVVVLHIFAVGMVFSCVTPLLSPFVGLFLVIKRKVDRTNMLMQPCVPIEAESGMLVGTTNVAMCPLNCIIVTMGVFQLGQVFIFTDRHMYGLATATLVLFFLTTVLYGVLLCIGQLPHQKFKTGGCFRKVVGMMGFEWSRDDKIDDKTPITSQFQMSFSETIQDMKLKPSYEHPALSVYLGGRPLTADLADPELASQSAERGVADTDVDTQMRDPTGYGTMGEKPEVSDDKTRSCGCLASKKR